MFKKSSLIFILGLAAILVLVSCSRSASQSPQTALGTPTANAATTTAEQAAGMGQVQQIGTTQMIQTMTAASAQMLGTQTGGQATSTPLGSVGIPNTFTLVPPTGVATTPTPGIAPVIVATSTPGRPATYTLMPGEFPYCIARRFNVNQQELLALNGLTTPELYQPGMQLRIPQTGGPFVGDRALNTHPGTYTVSSSEDTIYKVACYYGNLDPTQIIAANGLISPYTLRINQTLNIP